MATTGAHTPWRLPGRRLPALGRAGALIVALLAVSGLAFRHAYPGMASGMWNQMRYGTIEENENLWGCIGYWLTFMQKLRLDPASGIYNFNSTPEAGLDDFERGRLAFHRGDFPRAVVLLERHVAQRGESEEGLFWLAMSYIRLAEAENCLAHLTNPRMAGMPHEMGLFCSLPLRRTHDRQEPSRRAAHLFERMLDRLHPNASNARLYRWLLNFSYMTVDGFPSQVPARHLIRTPFVDAFYGAPAEQARQRYSYLRFTDRAQAVGLAHLGTGRGVAVEDFDNDGYLDIVATGPGNAIHYYRNEGGTHFTDVTGRVGLGGIVQPFTISVADIDGDGWLDLLIVCPFNHYRLFRNNGDGTFRETTAESGLLDPLPRDAIAASWITTWGDVNNDGRLDLFVANWAFRLPFVSGVMAKPRMDSKLFVNDGNGHFHDATAEFGLADLLHDRYYIGAAFGDYDGDGYEDLYLSSPLRGTSVLLHNVAGPTGPASRHFVPTGLIPRSEPVFTGSFVDVDQDGRLDIFQAGFSDARTSVEQAVFGEHTGDYKTGHSSILLQTQDGRFAAHDEFFAGGSMPIGTMGANYGDLDNDGCLDFYLGTGNPEPWFVLPNLMYLGEQKDGRCTGRMANISMLAGFGNVQKGHGIVFFDFDNDGRQDVLSNLGGMWPADQWMAELFVNESVTANSWVKVRLRGRTSNRFGVGSMIGVRAHTVGGKPIVRTYHMDSKTGFGSSPYLAHVGLGPAVAIDGVWVTWLGSGCRHTYPARIRSLNLLDEADCLAERLPVGGRATR